MKNRDNLMRHINVGKQLFSCILTEYEDNLANINDDICIKTKILGLNCLTRIGTECLGGTRDLGKADLERGRGVSRV